MKTLSLFFACSLITCTQLLFAQGGVNFPDVETLLRTPGSNYRDVQNQIESILAGSPGSTSGNDEEDQNYLMLRRWNWFWSHRLNAGNSSNPGGFDLAYEAIRAQSTDPICPGPLNNGSNWHLIGPTYQPATSDVGPSMGIVVSILHQPTDPDIIYIGTNASGLWKTTNGGLNWACMTDVLHIPGLGIQDIVFDPADATYQTIFIATGKSTDGGTYGMGVLRSNDGGATWPVNSTFNTCQSDPPISYPYVSQLLIYHQGSDFRIYAPMDKYIWLSTDGGTNFNCLTNTDDLVPLLTNQGQRPWKKIVGKPNDTAGNIFYFVSEGDGTVNPPVVGKTTDAFATVLDITPGFVTPPWDAVYSLAVSPADPDFVWAGTGSYLQKYSHSTQSWTSISTTSPNTDIYYNDLFVSPYDANVMYFGNVGMQKNTNGGSGSWTPINGGHDDKRAIEMISGSVGGNSDVFLCGHDGGISKVTNGGTTWTDLNGTGLAITQFYGLCSPESDHNIIAGGAQDNGYMTYTPGFFSGGNDWDQNIHADGYDCECDQDFANNHTMYGVIGGTSNGAQNLRRTLNSGNSWGSSPSPPDLNGPWHAHKIPMLTNPINHNFYTATRDVYTSGTNPFTTSFSPTYPGPNRLSSFTSFQQVRDCKAIIAIAVAPSNPLYVYAAFVGPTWSVDLSACNPDCAVPCNTACNNSGNCTKMQIWRSTDGGASWTDIGYRMDKNLDINATDALRYVGVSSIVVDPTDPNRAWFSFDGIWGDNSTSENRVNYFNYDGNDFIWRDMSVGLPGFPVNKIIYQNNTNDQLYAGTDVGVFYTNAALNYEWQCYNDFLPACIVTDLEINYCAQLIRASTFGRGIWESPLAPAPIESVSSSTTWSTNRTLHTDLYIEPGVTLTITSVVNIAANKKIVVKQRGILIINGGTLTNGCGLMWKGIEVWGNQGQSQQTAGAQGKVITQNNAVIENAVDAMRVWEPGVSTSAGGIVWCENTTFRNNKRSIEFVPYQNYNGSGFPTRNLSFFNKCIFTVDDQYRGNNDFYAHVTMWYVDGIPFRGCTFENIQTNVSSSNLLGYGISSLDANFVVEPYCDVTPPIGQPCPAPDFHQSLFKGLLYGISASKTAANRNFSVDQSIFENNMVGVYSRAVDRPVITRNTFTIGNNPAPMPVIDIHTGIMINTGNGYKVEDNTLSQDGNTPPTTYTMGIWIINSGAGQNRVYNNNLDGLFDACISTGINKSNDPMTGLQFLCNEITNTIYRDISVVKNNSSSTGDGIRVFQGDPNFPTGAGNEFSYNSVSEGSIFNASGSFINYYFHASGSPFEPQNYNPTWVASIGPTPISPACTSSFGSGREHPLSAGMIQELRDEYDENESAYLNVLYNYKQLIDDGNTNALLEEMEISWSQDAWTLRDELLERSPYLSEEVLRETAVTGVLPNAMLLEVCLANPDATKNDAFIGFLQTEIPNPMPAYMTDLIMATWEGVTPRTILEGSLASYGEKMASDGDLLLTDLLLAEPTSYEDIQYWLDRIQTLSAKYALTESYFQQNELSLALEVLNSIPENFNLKDAELAQYDRYVEYYNFRDGILNQGRTFMQLETDEIDRLIEFANRENDLPGIMAQNLLCFGYNICPEYLPELPEGAGARIANSFRGNVKSLYNEIKVTPNPAVDFAAFTYNLLIPEKQAILSITDLTGRVVQEFTLTEAKGQIIWDTRIVNRGIYLYHVKGDYSDQTRGKILVNKF